MAVIYVCDGCGEKAPGEQWPRGIFKPRHWYERQDDDGTQLACSRECIDKVAKKSGKTDLVVPI